MATRPPGGQLALISTPIGNMRDMTLRALDLLRGSHVVLCEDTRVTARLLHHYHLLGGRGQGAGDDAPTADSDAQMWPGAASATLAPPAEKQLVSLNAHTEAARIAEVVAALRAGHDVAIVSDAGTPGISDPGARVIAAARAAGFIVTAAPGACAAVAALSLSGCDWSPGGGGDWAGRTSSSSSSRGGDKPADTASAPCAAAAGALILGFLPAAGPVRAACIADVAVTHRHRPVVINEAPARLLSTLADLAAAAEPASGGPMGAWRRPVLVCKELSKLHEAVTRYDSLAAALAALQPQQPPAPPPTGRRGGSASGTETPPSSGGPPRGEYSLVLLPSTRALPPAAGAPQQQGLRLPDAPPALEEEAEALVVELLEAGARPSDAARLAADATGTRLRAAFRAVLRWQQQRQQQQRGGSGSRGGVDAGGKE